MKIEDGMLVFLGTIRLAPLAVFLIILGLGALIATLVCMARLKPFHGEHLAGVWVTLFASVVLGALFAKGLYVLTTFSFDRFLDFSPEYFSLWGGVLGVTAAVALTAGVCRVKPMQALDAFAPAGALMLCVTRAAEFFLNPEANGETFFGRIGLSSDLLEDSWHICFAEAGIALVALLLAFTLFANRCTFMRTLYFVMSFQLLTELLHDQTVMVAGNVFIRVEQILCAIVMFVMLFQHARRGLSTNGHVRFAPCLRFFIPVALIIYTEFELDKCWINNMIWNLFANAETDELPAWADALYNAHSWIWYAVVLLCVLWMLILEHKLVSRRADNHRV